MPHNGSGTFNPDTTFADGNAWNASAVNAMYTDLAAGITNSLAKDGQSTMTGQFKAQNGSAAAPAITLGSDTDTGFYRVGANSIGLTVNGVLLATFDSAGITLASGATLGSAANIIVTANITNNAVTLAKLATQTDGTILSNVSGGSAVPAANTLHAILDAVLGSDQGSVLYRGASTWARLGPGTNGQYLKTQGAAANPAWATVSGLPSGSEGQVLQYSSGAWAGSNSGVRCHGHVTVSVTTPTLQSGSVNVASVTRIAGPLYRVTFTTALANATYTAIVTGQYGAGYPAAAAVVAKTTTTFDIQFAVHGVAANVDPTLFDFVVHGGF